MNGRFEPGTEHSLEISTALRFMCTTNLELFEDRLAMFSHAVGERDQDIKVNGCIISSMELFR